MTEQRNLFENRVVEADMILRHVCRRLLGEMVDRLVQHADTPLHETLDTRGIVEAAARRVLWQRPSEERRSISDWPAVEHTLDSLTDQALADDPNDVTDCLSYDDSANIWDSAAAATRGVSEEILCKLARWLDRLHEILLQVSPVAVRILALRLEEYDDREIADRLGLGPRLVRRIRLDAEQNRANEEYEE